MSLEAVAQGVAVEAGRSPGGGVFDRDGFGSEVGPGDERWRPEKPLPNCRNKKRNDGERQERENGCRDTLPPSPKSGRKRGGWEDAPSLPERVVDVEE